MVGATAGATIVNAKVSGPSLPAALVAVILKELTAATDGVPVNNPPDEREAQAGIPVPLQVIGVVPVAANWNEYATPTVPPGNGLKLVIVGATPGTVKLKSSGPSLPVPLVAVTWIVVTATALGVPVSSPPLDSEAQPGKPVAPQVIGSVPSAEN